VLIAHTLDDEVAVIGLHKQFERLVELAVSGTVGIAVDGESGFGVVEGRAVNTGVVTVRVTVVGVRVAKVESRPILVNTRNVDDIFGIVHFSRRGTAPVRECLWETNVPRYACPPKL